MQSQTKNEKRRGLFGYLNLDLISVMIYTLAAHAVKTLDPSDYALSGNRGPCIPAPPSVDHKAFLSDLHDASDLMITVRSRIR
jgi:hypothetical protein